MSEKPDWCPQVVWDLAITRAYEANREFGLSIYPEHLAEKIARACCDAIDDCDRDTRAETRPAPEDAELVERLRRIAKIDGAEGYSGNARMLEQAADALTHLTDNLKSRDDFIVGQGLWHEFVSQLTKTQALTRPAPDVAGLDGFISHLEWEAGCWEGIDREKEMIYRSLAKRAQALTRTARDAVIEVKELEWAMLTAKTSFGVYWIQADSDSEWLCAFEQMPGTSKSFEVIGLEHANVEEAKAAAQADFETRIRSAMKGEG